MKEELHKLINYISSRIHDNDGYGKHVEELRKLKKIAEKGKRGRIIR